MKGKIVPAIMLTLLLTGILTLAFNVTPVMAMHIADPFEADWDTHSRVGSSGHVQYGYSDDTYTSAPTSMLTRIWGTEPDAGDWAELIMNKTFTWEPDMALIRLKLNYLIDEMGTGMAALSEVEIFTLNATGARIQEYWYIIAGGVVMSGDEWAKHTCDDYGPNSKYTNWYNEEIPAPGADELYPPTGVWYTLDRNVDVDFNVDWSNVTGIEIMLKLNGGYLYGDNFKVYFDDLELEGQYEPYTLYTLEINSSPVEITFTVDGAPRRTPWSRSYSENTSFNMEMPETYAIGEVNYNWKQWSDGNTSRSRTVTIDKNITLTAYYVVGPPVANFTWSPSFPRVDEQVTFDASASVPNGGNIVEYEWDFGDFKNATGEIVNHAYLDTGNYTVTLNVTDSEGFWDALTRVVTVLPPIHDVAVVDVTPFKTVVGQGYHISISTTVENQGTFTETFNVIAYANSTEIQTKIITNLNRFSSTVLTFEWETTEFPIGNYTIKAVTDSLPEEFDTIDNTLVDGTVTIQSPVHDVAVISVTPSVFFMGPGSSTGINVQVENQGNMKETFSVILFANEAEIQTKTVTNIDLATTQTLDFAWNATGFPLGNYIITATASIVPGETQVWDNIYVDGTVSITEETLVYVYPRITWTKPNQTFTIAIGVCNVVDMLTCGVGLHFDSTVLTWISGGVLQGSEVVAIRSFQPPITGNAILLRITFQGKEEGISSLHLDEMDTGLFDSHYNIIPSTKVDGEAHVAEHGIMVTKATPYKSIVGQGYSVKINATVENRGFFTETFNVAIFANTTLVQIQTIHNLAGGNFTTINFTWGTTGFAIGNYNITVYATPVSGETGTTDNNMTGGWVLVTIPGDVDGDLENGRYDVDLYDAVRLLARYGAKEGEPNFDPNCDIDNDGRVFLFDAVILLSHYGQKYP